MSENNEILLTWDGTFGRIISQGHKFTTNEKFDLGFDYDFIYYEPENGNKFKILKGIRIQIKLKEEQVIEEFCSSYADNQDYEVFAYEEKTGIYEGRILKSEAIHQNFKYRLEEEPSHPASKWVNDHWEKVKATILEDGTLRIDPPNICSKCVLAMTEEEFKEFPEQPFPIYTWDFIENKWIDKRDPKNVKENAYRDIRTVFETIRWNIMGEYVPQYEQETWNIQVEEAKDFLENSTAKTPYIDTFLNSRTDPNKPTKEELCKDILENHNNYIINMAKINAIQWKYLKEIEASENNSQVDEIQKEARNYVSNFLQNN